MVGPSGDSRLAALARALSRGAGRCTSGNRIVPAARRTSGMSNHSRYAKIHNNQLVETNALAPWLERSGFSSHRVLSCVILSVQ